jgi:hypothetical protein
VITAKYDPSIQRIREGATVADRSDGRIIGTVDSLGSGGGHRWALVSWPAVDQPWARTDARGRRGQVFSLDVLVVVDPPAAIPTDPAGPCQPTGPLDDPHLPGEARCIGGHGPLRGDGPLLDGAGTCEPGTPIWRVPHGDRDWRWADASGRSVVDLAPTTLRDDPAKWWASLFEVDPGTYSVLSAATSTYQASWLHTHRADGTEPPAGIDVPVCCTQPMHLVPVGWRCRESGLVFPFQGGSDA